MSEDTSQSLGYSDASSKCWASCLGGCSDKISREHTITKGMFLDNEITASGLPWCSEPKKVGLASLTSKVLCKLHNSALSPVDQEAVRFAESMRESFRLLVVRKGIKHKHWRIKKFSVDGVKMERWFLKTLINVTCNRGSYIGLDSDRLGLPSRSLVEIAFGKHSFQPRAGLYDVYDPPEKRQAWDGISIQTFNSTSNRVLGGVFSFMGFRLLLFLDRKGPDLPHMEIYDDPLSEQFEVISPTYHPLSVEYMAAEKVRSHYLLFNWAGQDR